MERITEAPRAGHQDILREQGLWYDWEDVGETGHWDETASYRFTAAEIAHLEDTTEELHARCLDAVDHLCRNPQEMDAFGIPMAWRSHIIRSWKRRDPHVMGRFDLAFHPGSGRVSMLEYNADTPTLAIETGVFQWQWLQAKYPGADQFNSLHEQLIDRLGFIGRHMPGGETLYFAHVGGAAEDISHAIYFADLAHQAGLPVQTIPLAEIGWCSERLSFVDQNDRIIRFLHKLHPWEDVFQDPFGEHLLRDQVGLLEPSWKALLSNKMVLPLLWRLFPGHPGLLEAHASDRQPEPGWVSKPSLSREGCNICLRLPDGSCEETGGDSFGDYESPRILQRLADIPRFGSELGPVTPVLGSWVVGDAAAGMIVRESSSRISRGGDRVLPHLFPGS